MQKVCIIWYRDIFYEFDLVRAKAFYLSENSDI